MQTSELSTRNDGLRLARVMLRLTRKLNSHVRALGGEDDLHLAEVSVLGQIERGHDLPSLIARALHLDPPRVTRITDRLVSLGYIERAPDASDRRLCRLHLTPAGSRRLATARDDLAETMEYLLEGLTDDERQGLEEGLRGMSRVLDSADL